MIDWRDFEGQIKRELKGVLGPIELGSIPAWRAPARGRGARTALGVKAVTGLAVVALAGAGATAAGAAALTGSTNPSDWGQQAAACRQSLRASGMNGFTSCLQSGGGARQTRTHTATQSPTAHSGGQGDRDTRPTPSPFIAPPVGPTVGGPPLISPGPGPGTSH